MNGPSKPTPVTGTCAVGRTGVITFDVGGRHFKVLRQTIESQPATLLASLIDDIGTDCSEPIFVDANPERFGHILDWYRFNEMFVEEFAVGALLRDARFFLLPDNIMINQIGYTLNASRGAKIRDEAMMATKAEWPTFEQYVEDIITSIKDHMRSNQQPSSERAPLFTASDLKDQVTDQPVHRRTCLYSEVEGHPKWLDQQNVCDLKRLRIVLAELRHRGFGCRLEYHLRRGFVSSIELCVGLGLDLNRATSGLHRYQPVPHEQWYALS